MAKLSAHGREVARFDFLTSRRAIMSDRTILENTGFGWKLWGKVKDELTIPQAVERQKAKIAKIAQDQPCCAAYKHALHALAGVDKRWKLHTAVELMPDDPGGVWSEVADGYGDNVHASFEEIGALCRLYQAWQVEKAERKQAVAQAAE